MLVSPNAPNVKLQQQALAQEQLKLHSSQIVILEGTDEDPAHKKQEEEADRFAADTLIPPEDYKFIVQNF